MGTQYDCSQVERRRFGMYLIRFVVSACLLLATSCATVDLASLALGPAAPLTEQADGTYQAIRLPRDSTSLSLVPWHFRLRTASHGGRRTLWLHRNELYLVDHKQRTRTLISSTAAPDSQASISADGNRIAFVDCRRGNKDVYLVDMVRHSLFNVSCDPADDWSPSISEDGKRVAFLSVRGVQFGTPSCGNLYVVDLERMYLFGASLPSPFGNGTAFDPRISADGKKVRFYNRMLIIRTSGLQVLGANVLGPSASSSTEQDLYDVDLSKLK